MQPDINITALVSLGKHPRSGRARRADQDARAVELGMKLIGNKLQLLHAGNADELALRSYPGMGLDKISVLDTPQDKDSVSALADYLSHQPPDIVLTGVRAEQGEASGMTPYLLGDILGWPVVDRIADIINIEAGYAQILQALPRGQRRALSVKLPFVASVDLAADAPRQSAFGPAQRATVERICAVAASDNDRMQWSESIARKRAKRLKIIKAKTAADRFKAATAKSNSDSGKVIKGQSPEEQAQAVFDFLLAEGVIR